MTRTIFLFSILLLPALCPAQDLDQFAKAHLPEGMDLAHPAVSGAFGPVGKHVVLLYRPHLSDGEFKGVVYVAGREKGIDLPAVGLIPNQFTIEVKAVFFEKLPGDSTPDLLILYGYHRNGSEADDSNACLVYQWRGNQFVRVPDVENKIVSLATADAVRKRLRQQPAPSPKKPALGGGTKP
jgi:hypothetical protein